MIQLKPDLLLAEKDGQLYVLDIEVGRVHSFNRTAKVIFQLCMEPIQFDTLLQEFCGYFPIPAAEASEDIQAILQLMNEYGLLLRKDNQHE